VVLVDGDSGRVTIQERKGSDDAAEASPSDGNGEDGATVEAKEGAS
jgi:hypothetical protein